MSRSAQRRAASASASAPPLPVPVTKPKQALVTGELVKFEASYTREIDLPRHLLLTVWITGGFARRALTALVSLLRHGAGVSAGRGWKDLRKGPEYLVTPAQVRDTRGRLITLEIHGYIPGNALRRGDQLRLRARRQVDARRPLRVYHIANLTTGQILEPRMPTIWSHLGPDLLLQATLGALLGLVVLVCLWGALT